MTNDLDEQSGEVARLYPAVYQRFHVSKQRLPGTDLTPRMLWILQHLASVGPSTLGELADASGVKKSTTTELVDRLEARGYVGRMRDDRDARRVFVGLTAAGERRATRAPSVLADDALRAALARMTADERDALVRGLRALVRAGEEPSR
ncbi:MAG TPA: MarR family winged helix-turn-helix transcriptional regulator [Candidatus Baltobacteraceae bacterium]|nr:MarR family winged helix-turn-helix transcriptional regulator [Candidatus Baltobacteraceae bacterium]